MSTTRGPSCSNTSGKIAFYCEIQVWGRLVCPGFIALHHSHLFRRPALEGQWKCRLLWRFSQFRWGLRGSKLAPVQHVSLTLLFAVYSLYCQEVCTHFAHTFLLLRTFNPFTAPTCKISGMNDERTRLQSLFSGPKICFQCFAFWCQCEKEDKQAEGFQISHFYGSFSNDIMAVKWLNCESFIHVGIVSFVCRVWHPCFPLNGIKKYLTVPSSSGIRIIPWTVPWWWWWVDA